MSGPADAPAIVRDDPQELATACAEWIVSRIFERNGKFRLALAGGNTPRTLYARLAADPSTVNWDLVEFYWGDERFVPATSQDSNYNMVHEVLLSKINVAAQNIHPVATDGTPGDAAARYEGELRRAYEADGPGSGRPLFDLVLLGLGADGHTCSLMPGSAALGEKNRWVASVPRGNGEARITLTYPALASSRHVAFFVTGAEKTKAVAGVRAGDGALPASHIKTDGDIIWFLDRAADGG